MKKFIFTITSVCILFFGGIYIYNSVQTITQNKEILNFLNSVATSNESLSFPKMDIPSTNTNSNETFSFGTSSNSVTNQEISNGKNNYIDNVNQNQSNNINNSSKANLQSDSTNNNSNGQLLLSEGNINVNGISLLNTLKGNSAIAEAAQKITASYSTPVQKAEALYVWIAANINYNDAYAKDITNGNFPPNMGTAIDTFNSKQAVCSGFAALYFVMAKDVGLNVKLVSGQGLGDKYNNTWGSHMWNEVYINNQWIPIDATFANSYTVAMKKIGATPELKGYLSNQNTIINKLNGFNMETYTVPSADFFDPANFYSTHKDAKVLATWIQ
ncbi:transglutaminase-like domain-containing protein [uncultured Clostridium sp.]|uniref:transglutaminase domain-containing protein n=1 Tax=uncultured Clostridium sp. TaxID=59620 RepID=UPI0026066212|nr:transglutaminase-like domain-containing protein [uncultured Clostridium sp.]